MRNKRKYRLKRRGKGEKESVQTQCRGCEILDCDSQGVRTQVVDLEYSLEQYGSWSIKLPTDAYWFSILLYTLGTNIGREKENDKKSGQVV